MKMFNIVKHCQSQRENSCVNYNKLKTATNDPSITDLGTNLTGNNSITDDDLGF